MHQLCSKALLVHLQGSGLAVSVQAHAQTILGLTKISNIKDGCEPWLVSARFLAATRMSSTYNNRKIVLSLYWAMKNPTSASDAGKPLLSSSCLRHVFYAMVLALSHMVRLPYPDVGPTFTIPFWLLHVDGLLQIAAQEGNVDVQLVKLHVFRCRHCQQGFEVGVLADRCRHLIIVDGLLKPLATSLAVYHSMLPKASNSTLKTHFEWV